jgi:hypothetical protein
MDRKKSPIGLISALMALLFGAVAFSLSPAPTSAQEKGHKLTLRAIMYELGAEYLRLTNALLIGDFKGLEESAKAIQGHPLHEPVEGWACRRMRQLFQQPANRSRRQQVKRDHAPRFFFHIFFLTSSTFAD